VTYNGKIENYLTGGQEDERTKIFGGKTG